MFETLPVALLSNTGSVNKRLFSTGYLKDIISASFAVSPIFESKRIENRDYDSGYPLLRARVEDLFRTDIDEIVYVSVNNKMALNYHADRVLSFYEKYIGFLNHRTYNDNRENLADRRLTIDAAEKELKIEKILEYSEKLSEKLLI